MLKHLSDISTICADITMNKIYASDNHHFIKTTALLIIIWQILIEKI